MGAVRRLVRNVYGCMDGFKLLVQSLGTRMQILSASRKLLHLICNFCRPILRPLDGFLVGHSGFDAANSKHVDSTWREFAAGVGIEPTRPFQDPGF